MEQLTARLQQLKTWLQEDRGRKAIIGLGIVGIGLIFLSGMMPASTHRPAEVLSSTGTVTAESYAARLESRLGAILGQVAGAGKCQVLVTLENGLEYQYAREEESEQNIREEEGRREEKWTLRQEYVLTDNGQTEQPLLITELQPEIRGVVVVCAGAGNPQVQQRVVEVVTTAVGVSSAKVCVVPMS